MKTRPLATDSLSTTQYVADFDRWAKSEWKSYSRRSFAKWAKVASPNFLSLVIHKKRPLAGAWLEAFIMAAKLSQDESSYLRLLSQFENSRDPQTRSEVLLKMQKLFAQKNIKCLASDHLQILTDPVAWTLYHMLDLNDQKATVVWFKNRLRIRKWKGSQIQKSLELLRRLELVEPSVRGFNSKHKLIESPDQIQKQANLQYHKSVLREAAEVLEVLEPLERTFGSLTATVSREKIEGLKSEVQKFGQYLLKNYASTGPVDGEVIRINIQLYPLTQEEKLEK